MPGAYRARLTVSPASGAPLVMEQPFALVRDAAVILTDAELRQLHATRLTIARVQSILRQVQARLDSAQRQVADARRAADSSSATPPSVREQLASLESELASVASQLGGAPGRGGGGGAAGGAGRGGRAGGAGAGRGGTDDDDQQGPPPTPPTQTISARAGRLNELMAGQFNPNPDQRRSVSELPALLRQQGDKLEGLLRERIPAVQQALRSAGVMK